MDKPQKPNINMPTEFATNGVKTDFTAEKLLNGFPEVTPDVLAGDNLNKFIDDVYKASNYSMNSIEHMYSQMIMKEVHVNPELIADENGLYNWTINHKFAHSDIKATLYRIEDNAELWGKPKSINNTEVKYSFKSQVPVGTIKAVLIG